MRVPVYLDNHATTRVDPRVLEAMLPWFGEEYGNAASVNHAYGTVAARAVDEARERVARLLNAEPRAVTFTSGATEANNLALKGVVAASTVQRPHVVVTAAEHRAVLDPARRLQRNGAELTVLPVDEHGRVSAKAVAEAIQPETVLVSAMFANNEVGTFNPVAEIGGVCRERGVLFHCDAVQAAGRVPVDVAELPVDLLSLSAHKLYGPKGVGALYVRRGAPRVRLRPLIEGGGHEHGLRSGTLPVPLIVGFGRACVLAREEGERDAARIRALRDRLWEGLRERVPDLVLNGHPAERLPGNLNVSVPGVDGDALMTSVTEVACSSGSACTSADPEPSHVLQAMGRPEGLVRASLRFGVGRFNDEAEIDFAVEHVAGRIAHLRSEAER